MDSRHRFLEGNPSQEYVGQYLLLRRFSCACITPPLPWPTELDRRTQGPEGTSIPPSAAQYRSLLRTFRQTHKVKRYRGDTSGPQKQQVCIGTALHETSPGPSLSREGSSARVQHPAAHKVALGDSRGLSVPLSPAQATTGQLHAFS